MSPTATRNIVNMEFNGGFFPTAPNRVEPYYTSGNLMKSTSSSTYISHPVVNHIPDSHEHIPFDNNNNSDAEQLKRFSEWNKFSSQTSHNSRRNEFLYKSAITSQPIPDPAFVYPWMKRIHINHGKFCVRSCRKEKKFKRVSRWPKETIFFESKVLQKKFELDS